MLLVSPLRSNTKDENQEEMDKFSIGNSTTTCYDFADLSDGNLLESINFDDFFVGIDDVLPDLEMDPDNMFAEFSLSGGEESEINSSSPTSVQNNKLAQAEKTNSSKKEEDKDKISCSGQGSGSTSVGEEIVSKRDESVVVNPSTKDGGKGRKSSSTQGKRKVKVDWTPELHRRFVQAVEQLGVDKAVPSRILEIMGIHSLTRHNIASHLQKYRSHRKHLLAREAEAANWNIQRRQIHGTTTTVAATGGVGGGKREVMSTPWATTAPTLGFPPIPQMHPFRPLHVWGHPSMDHSFMHMWPNHSPPRPPPLSWPPVAAPPPPLQDNSVWNSQHQRAPNPNAIIPAGAPSFPQHVTSARFGCSPVPHAMFNNKADHGIAAPGPVPVFDFHPSKESIDAAIGDALTKPWLPLPLGLKAPALDSVMGELQRQGISNIPPSTA